MVIGRNMPTAMEKLVISKNKSAIDQMTLCIWSDYGMRKLCRTIDREGMRDVSTHYKNKSSGMNLKFTLSILFLICYHFENDM